ncbi:MAG: hypothetical protein AAGC56_09870 [Pseudomonadota bacterium]
MTAVDHHPDPRGAGVGELRISVVVGAAFLAQTALALVWTGAAAERLTQLERQAQASEALLERTARLEATLDAVRADLVRIDRKLSKDRPERETDQ